MTKDVSPPSVIANTTSSGPTARSPICLRPNDVKSSKPSTDLISAKSPPAITLRVRSSHAPAAGSPGRDAPLLPEGPPDRVQLDAETSGRAAAREEDSAAAAQAFHHGFRNPLRLIGSRPLRECGDDVAIDVEQDGETIGRAGAGAFAQFRRTRV